MNKYELIYRLKESHQLSRELATKVVNLFFQELAAALANGDRVEIRGLCSMCVKEYKPYIGRDPRTGKSLTVPPKRLPFFKCSKKLKERVNKMSCLDKIDN